MLWRIKIKYTINSLSQEPLHQLWSILLHVCTEFTCMHAKGFSVSQFLDRLRADRVQWLVCHHHRILIAFNRTMSNGAIYTRSFFSLWSGGSVRLYTPRYMQTCIKMYTCDYNVAYFQWISYLIHSEQHLPLQSSCCSLCVKFVYVCIHSSYMTLIGVHEMHGRVYPY